MEFCKIPLLKVLNFYKNILKVFPQSDFTYAVFDMITLSKVSSAYKTFDKVILPMAFEKVKTPKV
jgi:hypothetical protein